MAESTWTPPAPGEPKCPGCTSRPRGLQAILRDLEDAPRRAMQEAAIASGGVVARVNAESRRRLSVRLTRFQLELAGYCPGCALLGQLTASEMGLGGRASTEVNHG